MMTKTRGPEGPTKDDIAWYLKVIAGQKKRNPETAGAQRRKRAENPEKGKPPAQAKIGPDANKR